MKGRFIIYHIKWLDINDENVNIVSMYFDFHWEVGRDDNKLLDINYVTVKIK